MKENIENLKENITNKFVNIKNIKVRIVKKYNFKKSYKYNVMALIIAVGYIFFMTSNKIFNSEGNVMPIVLNKEMTLQNFKVTMKTAKYSNINKKLEVNFKIEKTNLTYENKIEIDTKERNNPQEKIKSKLIDLNGKDYVAVVDLPKKWTTVLVTLKDGQGKDAVLKFYIDRREIEEDVNLKEKTTREYLLQSVEKEVSEVNDKIDIIDGNVSEADRKIEKVKEEIKKLEEEKKYSTETESLAINQNIDRLKNEISTSEKEKIKLKEEKEELNKKIEKLNIKESDYDKIEE